MTYKEAYRECVTEAEATAMAERDAKLCLLLMGGNPDRLKAIEDAFNEVAKEKGWRTDGTDK